MAENGAHDGWASGAASSFTYNQDLMVILKETVNRHRSRLLFACDDSSIAMVESLLAVHSQPFNVRNFYTRAQVRHEICCRPRQQMPCLVTSWQELLSPFDDPLYTAVECIGWNQPLDPMYTILQRTFESVANAADGDPLPEEYAPIVQHLESEMQAWTIVEDDEVAWVGGKPIYFRGVEHKAWWDGEMVAIKSGPLWGIDRERLACFIREAAVHASLAHPNIVRLYGVTPSCKLITELADGNLQQMCCGKSLEWRVKRSLLLQASAGLTYLHTREEPVVHGSVSSLNFVTFGSDPDSCTVKLAEFGRAATGEYARRALEVRKSHSVWMCPETLVTTKSDVFSFGVVAYEVVSGKVPYHRCGAFLSYDDNLRKKTSNWEEPCPVRPMDCPTELRNLMKRCCSSNPSKRPTMEEVNQCLMGLPEEWSREVDTVAIASRVSKSLRRADIRVASFQRCSCNLMAFLAQQMHKVKHILQHMPNDSAAACRSFSYNHKLMEFLVQQMAKANKIMRHMPKEPAAARGAQEWRVSWYDLDDAVQMGCSLIRRHSKDFNIRNYYTVQEAQNGVTRVCEQLRSVVVRWHLGIHVEAIAPDAAVAEDDRFLHECLVYVFQEGSGSELLVKAKVEDWLRVKMHLAGQLSRLKMVKESDIDIGQSTENGRSAVCHAKWNGRDVAVKRLRLRGAPDLNPQDFAKFYTEACIQASLSHPHIAKLLAVSKSGQMVMELANWDLGMLYKEAHLDWTVRYRFLIQVAEALEYMHSRKPPVVHCDVKSPNILIFGDKNDLECCSAKLSDFGISVKDTATGPVTVRCPGGSPHWMAPETYGEVHPSLAADVFGFGVVMYEVVSQMPPYGGKRTPCATIYRMKCEGQPPCSLPSDCPSFLKLLMERCCSVDPASRPPMWQVRGALCETMEAYKFIHSCLASGQPVGARSVVCQGRLSESDVAVKRLKLSAVADFKHRDLVVFCMDSCFQSSLKHPFIARLLEQRDLGLMISDESCCDLGTLYREAYLDWTVKYRFLIHVAVALEYMHSRKPAVVHGDVKSPNILVFGHRSDLGSCTAKLSDFGVSIKDTSTVSITVRRPRGTPHWMAPEIYDKVPPSPAADVFGFGVVMYEVASQTPPYGGRGTPYATIYCMKCEGRPACRVPDNCPPMLKTLMERCCSVNPSNQPSMRQVLEILSFQPWEK